VATLKDYRGVIDGYLLVEFGEQPLEAITPDAIDAYKERLIAEGRISNRVIVRHLTVLHGIFRRAKRVWDLAGNPASADTRGTSPGRLHRRVRHLQWRRGRAARGRGRQLARRRDLPHRGLHRTTSG
jgi:hypothetical protein